MGGSKYYWAGVGPAELATRCAFIWGRRTVVVFLVWVQEVPGSIPGDPLFLASIEWFHTILVSRIVRTQKVSETCGLMPSRLFGEINRRFRAQRLS